MALAAAESPGCRVREEDVTASYIRTRRVTADGTERSDCGAIARHDAAHCSRLLATESVGDTDSKSTQYLAHVGQ